MAKSARCIAFVLSVLAALARCGPACAEQAVLYAVTVNGEDVGEAQFLRLEDGRLLAQRADLERWRLRPPRSPPRISNGQEYFALDEIAGFRHRVVESRQLVEIEFSPGAFDPTVIGLGTAAPAAPTKPGLGAFANYDVTANEARGGGSSQKRVDGLAELGLFNGYGVGVASVLAQDVTQQRRVIRLDTSWTHDDPARALTLTLGDTIGQSGVWGRPVRFAGMRFGTNYATQPGFVTFPLPALSGESALPSTMDLYIDGILRQSRALSPGPFQITNVPVVTGRGDISLVVRDMLGREQVVTLPYYASTALLKEGLQDYSLEAGFVRNNYGLRSNDYGHGLLVGQYRKGISDRFTAEARAEILRDQQTAGAGASMLLPIPFVVAAAAAFSRGPMGSGALGFLGIDHATRTGVSFGIRSQMTTEHFTQLGLQPGQLAPRRLTSANAGFARGAYGSVNVSYARQDNRGSPDAEIVSASYGKTFGRELSMSVSAFKTLTGDRDSGINIIFTMFLGNDTSGSASYGDTRKSSQSQAQLQRNLPQGPGYGYRLLVGTDSVAGGRGSADLALQNDVGTYEFEAARLSGTTAYRATASGGVAWLEGSVFASRRINDSFGLVQLPDFPNIGVYVNNQLTTRTDSSGNALLPRLLPYQSNPVRIDASELPLDAQVDLEQVVLVPYFRSAATATFPVKRVSGALLTLVLDDGKPMPLGATVKVMGQGEEYTVAFRGEVYVTSLAATNRLEATWRGQACRFDLVVPRDAGPVPKIGPIACPGVKR